MSPTITMKFGGTSVGRAEAILRAADIVRQTRENTLHANPPLHGGPGAVRRQVVVVASAMSGVTNDLVRAARCAVEGDEAEVERIVVGLRERHRAMKFSVLRDIIA